MKVRVGGVRNRIPGFGNTMTRNSKAGKSMVFSRKCKETKMGKEIGPSSGLLMEAWFLRRKELLTD